MLVKKLTPELQPGDVVKYADMLDTVTSVEVDGSSVVKVHVVRNGEQTFFYAGTESTQSVVTK